MAKMFYTLEETEAALGKNKEQIKQLTREGRLREFRDGPRLMFKSDQVAELKAELNPNRGDDEYANTPTDAVDLTDPLDVGSGLLDLTRESDDDALSELDLDCPDKTPGAELEINPGDESGEPDVESERSFDRLQDFILGTARAAKMIKTHADLSKNSDRLAKIALQVVEAAHNLKHKQILVLQALIHFVEMTHANHAVKFIERKYG